MTLKRSSSELRGHGGVDHAHAVRNRTTSFPASLPSVNSIPLIDTLRSTCVLPSSIVSSGEKAEMMATRDLESAGPAVSACGERQGDGGGEKARRQQAAAATHDRSLPRPLSGAARGDGGYWGAAGPPARVPQTAWKSGPGSWRHHARADREVAEPLAVLASVRVGAKQRPSAATMPSWPTSSAIELVEARAVEGGAEIEVVACRGRGRRGRSRRCRGGRSRSGSRSCG